MAEAPLEGSAPSLPGRRLELVRIGTLLWQRLAAVERGHRPHPQEAKAGFGLWFMGRPPPHGSGWKVPMYLRFFPAEPPWREALRRFREGGWNWSALAPCGNGLQPLNAATGRIHKKPKPDSARVHGKTVS